MHTEIIGWPTAQTACKVCGEPIVYFRYWDAAQTKPRRAPAHHNGHCAATWDKDKAAVRLRRYRKQRAKTLTK